MRYGGEYKFAGGSVDVGETLKEAARRKLSEDFDCDATECKIAVGLSQTRPVQNMPFIMIGELLLVAQLDIEQINRRLKLRRIDFAGFSGPGPNWDMSKEGKEAACPEVHKC
jgi:ADP-ribose pyrophosphatase YjhB (NUDIX family)